MKKKIIVVFLKKLPYTTFRVLFVNKEILYWWGSYVRPIYDPFERNQGDK